MQLLKNKIIKKKITIAVIGIGYVGLPLCFRFLKKGYKVYGIDKDRKKIKSVKKGKSYIASIEDKEIKNAILLGFKITNDFSVIGNVDVIIVCVPTPLNKNKTPDMSYISEAVNEIKNYIKKRQMIILESTIYPGATEEFFLPILYKKKLEPGKDVFLAYSPEREDPGNKNFTIIKGNIPKIVSGFSSNCLELAKILYSSITKIVKVSSIKTAEFTKLLENVYRSINIGFVNEMKLIANSMDINVDLETLKNIFASNELNFSLLENQVKTELLWNSLIFQLYKDRLSININEINDQLELIQDKKEIEEYLISEIIAKPVPSNELKSKIDKIKKKISTDGFENTARDISIAESALSGGDLGWVNENVISSKFRSKIINTPIGSLSEPILLPEGILIFKVRDKKKLKTIVNLEDAKDQLVNAEKTKLLNMHSLSHFDNLKRSISINYFYE